MSRLNEMFEISHILQVINTPFFMAMVSDETLDDLIAKFEVELREREEKRDKGEHE